MAPPTVGGTHGRLIRMGSLGDRIPARLRRTMLPAAHALIARSGFRISRTVSPHLTKTNELVITLEFALAHLVAYSDKNQLTAVQVGAHDGSDDPLERAIATHGLRALLIEPQPGPCEVLRRRYEAESSVTIINAAIGATDGHATLYTLANDTRLPDWADRLASFDRGHLQKYSELLPPGAIDRNVIELTVDTMTFDTALQADGIDQVDILQIDTEGYDLEILRLFDIPRRLPSIVNFERINLSHEDQERAVDLLLGNGYLVCPVSGRFDTLAYRPPVLLA